MADKEHDVYVGKVCVDSIHYQGDETARQAGLLHDEKPYQEALRMAARAAFQRETPEIEESTKANNRKALLWAELRRWRTL